MKTTGMIGCALVACFALAMTWLATAAREAEQGPVLEVTTGPGTLTPSARAYHSMARRGSTYMFGGFDGTRKLDETWKKRGQMRAWYLRELGGPEAREQAGMVFHSVRGTLILFGGKGPDGALYDTWEHRGGSARNQWTLKALTGPAARYGHAMTYDDHLERVVLFGGTDGTQVFGDTWECVFQGDIPVWRQIANTGPPARFASAMVYDTSVNRTVLFGGVGEGTSGPMYRDTWELVDSTWEWIANSGPEARRGHGMVVHTSCSTPVLFGGTDGVNAFDDTWMMFGEANWVKVAEGGPPARTGHAMAFDCFQNYTVINGGMNGELLDDTWVLNLDCNVSSGEEFCNVEVNSVDWTLEGPTALPPERENSRSGSGEGSSRSRSSSSASLSCDGCGGSSAPIRREQCRGDVDQSQVVDVHDLVGVISAIGRAGGPADVDDDGTVNALDVMAVIMTWGGCP